MEARRGGRPSQVRPRPSSPAARGRIRAAPPSPSRLGRHRTIERRAGLPLVAKAALAGGVVVLGWLCLMIGLGLVRPAVSSLASGVGGMLGALTSMVSTPAPSSAGPVTAVATIRPPDAPVTNLASVDLTVQVPAGVVGTTGYTCRLYVTLPDAQPVQVMETPIGGTATLVMPSVALAKGANVFTATIVGPGGEGPPSQPVTITLDVSKPPITITAPKNGSSVKGSSVTVRGKTQAASTVRIQNAANGATATTTADDAGVFSAAVTIAAGPNALTVTVTDPAGNGNAATVTVASGTGVFRVTLSGTVYQFDRKKLPASVTFTALVIGADGKRVAGASALFTVSVPGLQPLVSVPATTDSKGTATFTATIPKGAMAGSGLATVLVTMPTGTQTATDRAVLTVR